MRKLTLTAAAAALLFAASCNNSSSDQAATSAAQTAAATTGKEYTADATASSIHWQATHKGGAMPRYGTINITGGTIAAENGAVTGGSFDVDMNTIKVDSASVPEPADKGHKAIDLENHLKSADFFDVANHKTAKFVITGVTPFDVTKDKSMLEGATNIVSGNLTIKDSTVNVTFPAKITVSDASVDVQAKFTVDRTSWGLRLGAEGNPANWMISKDLELEINLKAVSK
ncbi:YceI family protein [Taibaiella lutea]|uniref:YceI family protein n=1 Tax=Taibaiella lutea TaxID=2608001 RepID=A0A5M6CVI3_9BACT|nr:YceI family protein [Taibaiella lutea]KAA5536985.1 YceI family protein [Taibaiella lutea]